MTGQTVTRAQLTEAVYQEVGLSRNESAELVESVIAEIAGALARGEMVKISSFGSFSVRQKGERVGRNPKTGQEVPISPRRVLVFRASHALKDQINAGGYKVWPREVEDVLYQHEAVREAAVVGVPDAYRGETVKAYVSLRPGQTATAEELIAFCRQQMAAYKYPRQVEFLDELPKTVSGKLLRRELRDRG